MVRVRSTWSENPGTETAHVRFFSISAFWSIQVTPVFGCSRLIIYLVQCTGMKIIKIRFSVLFFFRYGNSKFISNLLFLWIKCTLTLIVGFHDFGSGKGWESKQVFATFALFLRKLKFLYVIRRDFQLTYLWKSVQLMTFFSANSSKWIWTALKLSQTKLRSTCNFL